MIRIIDLHCDTLYKLSAHNIPLNDPSNEVRIIDEPDSCKLQCYAIWLPDDLSEEQAERLFLKASDDLRTSCNELNIGLLQPGNDVREAFFGNSNTAYFTVENSSALNGKLDNVNRFAELGVRMMTLTWNASNAVGDGVEAPDPKGLTAFGKQVLSEMERCGIIADISHASQALFYDVASRAKRPIVASHSNSYAVTPHPRNLTDEQFAYIIQHGGLVGLNFHNAFLNREPEDASIEDILRHADHFLSVGGEDVLCFGSDFDGGTLPKDIKNSMIYDKIYEQFLQHHYSEALIKKIFYENALKFFENFDNR